MSENRVVIISALGVTQIFAWGSSYYLLAVLAAPIATEAGWSLGWVVGGFSLGLLVAGAVSPWVGRAIGRNGGRPVLAVGAVLLGTGLLCLAVTHSWLGFLAAWVVLGLGMGAGLYDPAFATLGRLYGEGGRGAITALTLFGGFASTVCWPLSALLSAHLGWRGACLVYAAIQLGVSLPIYVFVLPKEARYRRAAVSTAFGAATLDPPPNQPSAGLFLLLAATITLASVVSTVLSVHLLTILQSKGLGLSAAVGLGALVGPSQVAARAAEMLIARFHHPIWTKIAATSLVTAGVATLWFGGAFLTLALLFYGAGIGLESIARGTLPLAIFGNERYPEIMGRIARPSLIAQALAPTLGALLLAAGGAELALAVFFAVACANAILAFVLLSILRRQGSIVIPPREDGKPSRG